MTANSPWPRWIRPTQLRQGGIVCLGKYSWTHGWYLDMPNNQGVLRIETANPDAAPNGTVQSRPGAIRVNQWQHVAAVVRRGENQTQLFINGFQVARAIAAKGSTTRRWICTSGAFRIRNCSRGRSMACACTRARWERRRSGAARARREAGIALKAPPEKPQTTLYLGGREFMASRHQAPFMVVRLPKGPWSFAPRPRLARLVHQVNLTPLAPGQRLGQAL